MFSKIKSQNDFFDPREELINFIGKSSLENFAMKVKGIEENTGKIIGTIIGNVNGFFSGQEIRIKIPKELGGNKKLLEGDNPLQVNDFVFCDKPAELSPGDFICSDISMLSSSIEKYKNAVLNCLCYVTPPKVTDNGVLFQSVTVLPTDKAIQITDSEQGLTSVKTLISDAYKNKDLHGFMIREFNSSNGNVSSLPLTFRVKGRIDTGFYDEIKDDIKNGFNEALKKRNVVEIIPVLNLSVNRGMAKAIDYSTSYGKNKEGFLFKPTVLRISQDEKTSQFFVTSIKPARYGKEDAINSNKFGTDFILKEKRHFPMYYDNCLSNQKKTTLPVFEEVKSDPRFQLIGKSDGKYIFGGKEVSQNILNEYLNTPSGWFDIGIIKDIKTNQTHHVVICNDNFDNGLYGVFARVEKGWIALNSVKKEFKDAFSKKMIEVPDVSKIVFQIGFKSLREAFNKMESLSVKPSETSLKP